MFSLFFYDVNLRIRFHLLQQAMRVSKVKRRHKTALSSYCTYYI